MAANKDTSDVIVIDDWSGKQGAVKREVLTPLDWVDCNDATIRCR